MFTNDYLDFKQYVVREKIVDVGQLLAANVRDLARDLHGEPEAPKAEALGPFFTAVMRCTGEFTKGSAKDYYDHLIKYWGEKTDGGRNTSLVVATHYYLHTIRSGRQLALQADRVMFSGKTFLEYTGLPVPGAYELKDTAVSPSVAQELLKSVNWLVDQKIAELQGSSYEFLLSLALRYNQPLEGSGVEDLKSFLVRKAIESEALQRKIVTVHSEDPTDKVLLEQAGIAARKGNISRAVELFDEAERRFDAEIEGPVKAKCERIVLQADALCMGGEYLAAVSHYDRAASLIGHFDDALSLKYSTFAADALQARSHLVGDVPLMEVVKRQFAAFRSAYELFPRGGWETFRPLSNYIHAAERCFERGLPLSLELAEEAELLATEAIIELHSLGNLAIVANLQYSLGCMIATTVLRKRERHRLVVATRLLNDALQALVLSDPFDIWVNAMQGLGRVLMKRAEVCSSNPCARRAITVYETLIRRVSREDDPENWGRSKHNIGVCLVMIGRSRNDIDLIRSAVRHFDEALEDRSKRQTPSLYGNTVCRIADAYYEIAMMEGLSDLMDAHRIMHYYKEGLDVLTPEADGANWFECASRYVSLRIVVALEAKSFPDFLDGLSMLRDIDSARCRVGTNYRGWTEIVRDFMPLAQMATADVNFVKDTFDRALLVFDSGDSA